MDRDARIVPVTADDCIYEQHLARQMTDELGFLPRTALEWYADQGSVWRIRENDWPAGFVVLRRDYSHEPRLAGIIQAAIDFDSQRRHLGLALVAHAAREAAAAGKAVLQCWCAADLPANEFWSAAGFTMAGRRPGGQSRKRDLLLWRRPLTDALAEPLDQLAVDPRHRLPGGRFARRPETRQLSLFDLGRERWY